MRRLAPAMFAVSAAWLTLLVPVAAAAQTVADDAFVLRPSQDPTPAAVVPQLPDASTLNASAPAGRVTPEPPLPAIQPTDNLTTDSIPPPVKHAAIDPYAPRGIRSGGFVLYPSLTVTFGNTNNANAAAGGGASAYTILSPELLVQSDWDRNAATLDLRGSFRHFFDGTTANQPEIDANATARIDASGNWTFPVTVAYSFTTQQISDPNFPAGVDSPPGVHELKGTVALDRSGPALIQIEANLDRTMYENGTSGGSVVDQSDRTNTVLGGHVRLGYEITPSLAPFVEADVGRREFDRTVDDHGLRRSGLLQFYRAGIALDEGPVLTGDLALGYGIATFDDPSLTSVHAFTVDGTLTWAPTVLTTLTATGTTSLNPSTDPTSSGSVVYNGTLDLAYAWRENVTLDATGSARNERFQGIGEIGTDSKAGLSATWKANPTFWLTAGYNHEWLTSNFATRDFTSDEVTVALKTQR